MRLSVTVLTATLLTGSLVACSNGYGVSQTPSIPANESASAILDKIHAGAGHGRPDAVRPGIYAIVGSSIYAYPDPDGSNGPPVCSVGPVKYLSSLAVDRKGDLLAAAGVDHGTRSGKNVQSTVTILKGPGLCGPELGSITDPYGGRPTDVASRDAQSGKIVVGNDYGDGDRGKRRRGGVTVCTLSGGCTANFLTPKIRNVFAVALAPNGDCWASGTEPNGYEELAYFANCRGRGVIATGFQEFPYGLDIDDHGNLVVISAYGYGRSALYIYSGCNPTCSLVGGPFQLEGFVSYGHLDASSKHLVVADNQNSRLDVYSYSTKGIRFEYSITAGLSPSANVTGAAFSPSSKE